jgi:hypothetical protein
MPRTLEQLTCRGGSADRTAVFVVPHKQRKFLITIDKTVPADLDIHLVCDNYGTHKTPAIKAWLAKNPRFHMPVTLSRCPPAPGKPTWGKENCPCPLSTVAHF